VSIERHDGSPGINSKIKAVILDYGQVLAHCTAQDFGRMAEMFNVSLESFYQLWESSRGPYDRGDLTADEYWLKLAAQTNSSISREQIEILRQVEVEIWAHPDPPMLDWLSQLHAAGFKTALLSNMPVDLMTYVLANFQWMKNFTFKTFSCEVRLLKPDPAIYEHTLRGLGVAAAEALFVDDREPNIQSARRLGMRAILFRSVAQFKDDLAALGFPILPVAPSSAASPAVSPTEGSAREIKIQL
jgi:putative hydrolase of the HAD superfamily